MQIEFREWMIKTDGRKTGVASAYVAAVNEISLHYSSKTGRSIDIYKIIDIQSLREICTEYRRGGRFEDFGNKNNGLYRAAITKYLKFVEAKNKGSNKEKRDIEADNLEIISKAFRTILPSLSEFVGSTLKEKDNINWWKNYVINKLSETSIINLPKVGKYEECINSLDILACLNIIIVNWHDIFKYKFRKDKSYFNYAHEIIDKRHDTAHVTQETIKKFNYKYTKRALDTIALFMEPINSKLSDEIIKFISKPAPDTGVPPTRQEQGGGGEKKPKDNTKYIFNGKKYCKNRLVLSVIDSYVKNDPNVTLEKLQNIFDKEIQKIPKFGFNFDVVDSYANAWDNKNYKRYFFDNAINLSNGQKIVVCNQWAIQNIEKFICKAKELGYSIDIIKNEK